MPGPEDAGAASPPDAFDEPDDEWDEDAEVVVALLEKYADRLPDRPLPPLGEVAAEVRESAYLRSILALADWLGDDGRELTARRWLRPAVAREAYDALGLDRVHRRLLERRYPGEEPGGQPSEARLQWIDGLVHRPWRSAGDCEPLARLWVGAVGSGLVDAEGARAYSLVPRNAADQAWAEYGLTAIMALVDSIGPATLESVLDAMLHSYATDRGPVEKADWIRETIEDWQQRFPGLAEGGGTVDRQELVRGVAEHSAENAWGLLADTGLYTEARAELRLTALGDAFVSLWLTSLAEDLDAPEGPRRS